MTFKFVVYVFVRPQRLLFVALVFHYKTDGHLLDKSENVDYLKKLAHIAILSKFLTLWVLLTLHIMSETFLIFLIPTVILNVGGNKKCQLSQNPVALD